MHSDESIVTLHSQIKTPGQVNTRGIHLYSLFPGITIAYIRLYYKNIYAITA
jgi:hypothetical protein